VPVAVEGEDRALLLAALLDEALWTFESRGELAVGADVAVSEGRAQGELLVARGTVPAGPQIKAVTFHQLDVTERAGAWHATVYFDV
jgi:SHS2 domain-containing protein